MEYTHESKPSGLRVHIDSGTNGVDNSTANKKPGHSRSSSSSSPDSPLDDPFSKYENNDSKNDENNTIIKPSPTSNQNPPPNQAMERPVSSENRIPSHVFVRTKSTVPVEWSVASNESLFSIHMGDSSFGRESIFNYNYSHIQSPKNLTYVPGLASENKGDESAVGKSSLTPSVSFHSIQSDVSASSVNSFAFPILTGNNGKYGSTKNVGSVRIGFEYSSQQLTPTTPQKHIQQQSQQQPQQPKASSATCSSWFRFFTCCTARSK